MELACFSGWVKYSGSSHRLLQDGVWYVHILGVSDLVRASGGDWGFAFFAGIVAGIVVLGVFPIV